MKTVYPLYIFGDSFVIRFNGDILPEHRICRNLETGPDGMNTDFSGLGN